MAARRILKIPDIGSAAPDFRLPLLDGGEASLADLTARGRIVLAFFKVTCPICQLTFPYLERINQPGVLPVCGISQNDAEDTAEFNREFGVTFPTLLDGEDTGFPVSNDYGISSVPTLFVVERDRAISRIVEGWRKQEIEWLGSQVGVAPICPGEYVPEWKAG